MYQIQNAIFTVDIDPQQGYFSIFPREENLPALQKIRLGCAYHLHGSMEQAISKAWQGIEPERKFVESNEHGSIETLSFHLNTDSNGIETHLIVGIVAEYPLVLWRVEVNNKGKNPVELHRIDLLHLYQTEEGEVRYPKAKTSDDLGIFINGWQSWSAARWYAASSKMSVSQPLLKAFQHPMIYNAGTPLPRKKGEFSSDMFAVIGDRKARTGFLLGFLSQTRHFGSIYADFNRSNFEMWANGDDARLDPGKSISTDWAVFNPVLLDHRDPLDKYLDAVARENHVQLPEETPVGWCSWYHFYRNVTEKNIENNLEAILKQQNQLPIQLLQIDDGFESEVGDWFSFNKTFPEGVAPLAKKIEQEGLVPGLWLAPFAVHKRSQLFKQHPDWILRSEGRKPVNAGFGWDSFFTGLDLTIPEALEYACSVVRTAAIDWGYRYLKLDFLYVAALKGRYHDPTQSRAQVMRKGMEAIRSAVGPQVTLLGCGAPLGSMLGLVDAMRIGPDVSGFWKPHFGNIGILLHNEPSVPSARNSIYNVLTRSNLHQRWWINDPDCLLIREDTKLSIDEIRTLATSIAITGGSMLLSDDLPNLSQARMEIAEGLIPILKDRPRVIDWFDSEVPSRLRLDLVNETGEWHVLGVFNWNEQPVDISITTRDFQLTDGNYMMREFWTGKIGKLTTEAGFVFKDVPSHGCLLLAVRHLSDELPGYLGSTLHFSQGMEIAEWKADSNAIQATLRLPRTAAGELFFQIPGGNPRAEVNHQPAELKELESGIYSLPVKVDGFAHIKLAL